jgi:FkbM family methyltransferase
MTDSTEATGHAVECLGVKVPHSPFLHDKRIERIRTERYEGQEIRGALNVVRKGDRVLELGAGIGLVGAVVAANAGPATVRAYEANPALIPHIEALYALNGLGNIISVRNAVLMGGPDRPATMPFHIGASFLGSSLLDQGRSRATVEVPTADLAAVMADLAPDVLIIDIEGGEREILRHIDLSGLRAVVIEFHPEAYGVEGMQECKATLRAAGFAKVDAVSTRTVWTCQRAG